MISMFAGRRRKLQSGGLTTSSDLALSSKWLVSRPPTSTRTSSWRTRTTAPGPATTVETTLQQARPGPVRQELHHDLHHDPRPGLHPGWRRQSRRFPLVRLCTTLMPSLAGSSHSKKEIPSGNCLISLMSFISPDLISGWKRNWMKTGTKENWEERWVCSQLTTLMLWFLFHKYCYVRPSPVSSLWQNTILLYNSYLTWRSSSFFLYQKSIQNSTLNFLFSNNPQYFLFTSLCVASNAKSNI